MNKMFIMVLCMALLVIPMASAFEFDNIKQYNTETKTVTVKNSFGLGATIATIKLNTPLINVVPRGYGKVAEFTITSHEAYSEAIKELELYDKKNNLNKFTRQYDYKYLTYETVVVNDYSNNCKLSGVPNKCTETIIGTHNEQVEKWVDLGTDVKKDEVLTIGIFTEVSKGDRVEWIPNFFGIRVSEWAEWTEGLNAGLVVYYPMEDSSGNFEDVVGSNDLVPGGSHTYEVAGKVGNGIETDDLASWAESTANLPGGTKTVNFWYKNELAPDVWGVLFTLSTVSGGPSGDLPFIMAEASGLQLHNRVNNANQGNYHLLVNGNWVNIAIVMNASGTYSYINGALANTEAISNDLADASKFTLWSSYGTGTVYNFQGVFDELGIWNRSLTQSEITQLYNGGTGLTYTDSFGADPVVTLSVPNNINQTTDSLTFNWTVVDDVQVDNSTLWIDGVINQTITHGVDNYTSEQVDLTFTDGSYNWTVTGRDDENREGTTDTRYFIIDSTAPVINITTPLDGSEVITWLPEVNLTLDFTASDATIGLSACWYDIGSGNNTLACGTNTTTGNITGGDYTVYYYANDTLNQLATTSVDFSVNYLQSSFEFDNTVVEAGDTTFYFNITATDLTQANASLYYNNTYYPMSVSLSNTTTARFYKTLTAPLVEADTILPINVSYFLNSVAYNTSTTNLTIYNIPALNITAGLCEGTPVYWFDLKNEENLSTISGDFEYNFYYGLDNSSMVRTYGKVTGATNFSICTNTSISPTWTIGSGEILYSSAGYVDRRYYVFDDTEVTTATNVTLYDLLITSQTSFKLEIEDTSLNPYANIYARLLRWYPDLNEYKIVDVGKTDGTGSTVIHVRTEDVDYRIGAYETNGTIIYLADPIRMVCLASPCTYTLKISPGETDYTSFLNIDYTFTYDDLTGVWDFEYTDSTGKTSTMNLTVYRVTSTTIYPVCSDIISGAVGALSCNTSEYTTGQLRAEVVREASPPVTIVQKVVHLFDSAFKGSSFGLWLSLLIALPIIFLFSLISPVGALLGGIIALIPALYFGSINIGIVGGLAILAGIVAHFLKRVS